MRNILITGGAGFIGSNLSLALINKGYNVRVIDNLSPQIHGNKPSETSPLYQSIEKKVEFFKGDVTNFKDFAKALKGQDAVVHLAAETGTGQSMYEIKKYCDVNIGGTALLLDILTNQKHSIKKIIVASSRAIYGEGKYKCKKHGIVYPTARENEDLGKKDFDCKCPLCHKSLELMATSEDSQISPSSVYGITKYTQEQMVLTVSKSLNIPSVAFRYQNVYGPGQSLSNPYTGILSIFSTQIRNGNNINVFEDGRESRDFVYIDDVVQATILGLERNEANYMALNVGAGRPIDVLKVAEILKTNYDSDSKIIVSGNYRLGDIRHNYANLDKIKGLLNYSPMVSFEEGIRLFSSWVKIQKVQKDGHDRSILEMKSKGLFK